MKQLARFILFVFGGALLINCSSKILPTKEVFSEEIKAISFNIRLSPNNQFDGENSWFYRKEAVLKMIKKENPDVFGVQEAIYRQAKFLEDNLKSYSKYGVDRDGGLEKGEAESCAVFYKKERFKLINFGTFWLSQTPDKPSRGWDAACHRVVTWVHLKEKEGEGKELFFMNTHFDHMGEVARRESGLLLVNKIKELVPEGVALIVTGDFNAEITSPIMEPIKTALLYARENSPLTDSFGTFNNWGKANEGYIIDHIFYKNFTPIEYRTIKEDYGVPFISDHYPILFRGRY